MPAAVGTVEHPFYFLHLARSGGSSLTRLLDDAFPVAARCPYVFVDDLRAAEQADLDRWGVFCGHLGTLPMQLVRKPFTVVTVLREPAARAWSHFRMLRWSLPATAPDWERGGITFGDLLDDPGYGAITRDFQARWLALAPERDLRGPEWPGLGLAEPFGPGASGCDPAHLAGPASRTLDGCAVVGLTERLDETVEALSRLLGRPLGPAPLLNRGGDDPEGDARMGDRQAAEVRRRSPTDLVLARDAGRRLDASLATLPSLPAARSLPLLPLPWVLEMDDAFTGTGWHGRVRTTAEGWHRWSGPGVRSTIWLPGRARGRMRITLELVATASPSTLDGVRLAVQGRPVEPTITVHAAGTALGAVCVLDDARPVDVELTLHRTAVLHDAKTGRTGSERAGVALKALRIEPAGQPGSSDATRPDLGSPGW